MWNKKHLFARYYRYVYKCCLQSKNYILVTTMAMKTSQIILITALLFTITILPPTYATTYSISIRDVATTPEDPKIGDTLKIKVQYKTEGPSDPNVKLYLYVDDILEKTYSRSHSYSGTYTYTFYFDTDDLSDKKHEIKIKAKVYDGSIIKDTDTVTQNIYFDEIEDVGTYSIDIEDITITPSEAHSGDLINIRTKFHITAPQDPKVKLYLYIDGKQVKTNTQNYNRGTRYHTFSYSTDDLEKGIHTAKIKADLYRDSWLKDTDTQTESFHLNEKRDVNHDLDITSINFNTPISPKENIPVTITIKNNGNIDEEDVRIKMTLDSKTIYSTPFYLIRGQSKTRTLHIDTPEKSGRYELIIRTYNKETEQKSIQNLDIHGYALSMSITPKDEAYTGEWIRISGYARQDQIGTTKKLNIYKDDKYEKTIIPEENGYYTSYVKFDTAQYHKITVELEDIKKDKIIRINQKETEIKDTTNTDTISFQPTDDRPYTIIVIKEGKERIYIEESTDKLPEPDESITEINTKMETLSTKIDDTNENIEDVKKRIENLDTEIDKIKEDTSSDKEKESFGYVDIETSNNELIVSNYDGNLVTITITNNLNSEKVFRIDTNFNKDWTFLPNSKMIENKESSTFHIYFNPIDAKGEYKGNITIYQEDNIIKKIPLTLYVTEARKPPQEDEEIKFIGPKTATGAIYLIMLFCIVLISLYLWKKDEKKEEKKPLMPKIIPGYIGHLKTETTHTEKTKKSPILSTPIDQMKTKINTTTPQRPHGKGVYHVNWDQVIM